MDFRHVSHVGWDVNKGFDANLGKEESPELKAFFQQVRSTFPRIWGIRVLTKEKCLFLKTALFIPDLSNT